MTTPLNPPSAQEAKSQLESQQKVNLFATPSKPPPPTKPKNPLMGTCQETYPYSGSFYFAFGGQPLADWTGIKDLNSRSMSDLCFRSLDPVAGQKSAHYRTKGLSTKFNNKSSLTDFQTEVWEHLEKYGLDTISYLPDPKNISESLCTVTKHAQFTGDMSKANKLAENISSKFDIWDRKHDTEAKSFLMASLSDELKKDFKPFHDKNKDTFAMTWLKFVHYLVSSNSKTFDKLKDDVRKIRPQQYSGQNIEKMAADYITKAEELLNAGYFDHSLILNMVDGFLCASKDAKGTFHHSMNDLRRKVDKLQQETIFMSKPDQINKYAQERLSHKDVCFAAVKEYKTLCDDNMWEPKKLPKDRQTPASHAANLAEFTKALNLVANMGGHTNQQSKSNSSGEKANKNKSSKGGPTCFNCGKKGHIMRDCPEPKKTPEERKKIRHKNMPAWKTKPPSAGESHTKIVDGKTFYWCGKCGNWTSTHTEQQHGQGNSSKKPTNKKGNKKKSNFTPQTNLTAFEAEAWLVEIDNTNTSSHFTLLNLFKYIYFVLTLGILLGLPTPSINDLYTKADGSWELLINVIHTSTNTFWKWFEMLKIAAGPLGWILLGYLSYKIPVWYKSKFQPTLLEPTPRTVRRRSRSRSLSRPKYKLKSARDHNLHPKYPLRLRQNNAFNTRSRTPTARQRAMQTNLDDWIQSTAPTYSGSSKGSSSSSRSFTHPRRGHPTSNTYAFHPLQTHKSKGGNCYKRKHTHKLCTSKFHSPTKLKGSTPISPSPRASSSRVGHVGSFCQPAVGCNQSIRKQPCYVPKGLRTARDMPNHNLTVKQQKKLRDRAHSVLLMGTDVDQKTREIARNVSMLAPSQFRAALAAAKDDSHFQVVWDSGASICVSPDKKDFITYNTTSDVKVVKGVGGNPSSVAGQGEVEWSVYDTTGSLRKLKLKAYHIPTSKTRLISTSSLLNSYKGEYITINGNSLRLSGIEGDPTRTEVVVFNNPLTHLPTSTAFTPGDTGLPGQALYTAMTTVSENNHNLSEAQKELLRWHQRLGHLDFNKIKHLLRTGVLSNTEKSRSLHTAASKVENLPKCAACMFGKQTIRSAPGKVIKIIKDREGVLRSGNLLPGQEVSVDHFISSVRGRLFTGYNRGSIEDRYVGGCIFVDHASSYIHIEFQSSLSSHETLGAKMEYEKHCRDVGVIPQKYMSDNGKSFASKQFSEHLSNFYQISKFAGVGAHHHNAQAERAIRTIMSIARTMMIHSGIHWPDVADSTLWPMAVKHACFLYNHVPNHTTGLSPSDLFTRTRWPQRKLLDLHVWGCPIYVLEKALQDGKKLPKWKPRSSRSVYMGVSHKHSSSVPLVLSTSTGAITPQFHVVFDDWFATVGSDHTLHPDFSTDEWNKMFGESRYQYIEDELEEEDMSNDLAETIKSQLKSDRIAEAQDAINPSLPLETDEPPTQPSSQTASDKTGSSTTSLNKSNDSTANQTSSSNTQTWSEVVQQKSTTEQTAQRKLASPSPKQRPAKRKVKNIVEKLDLAPRRSTRNRASKPVERFTYTHDKSSLTGKANYTAVELTSDNIHIYHITPDYYVMVSSAKEANPDLFSYDEAMASEHRSEWIEAAIKEITALEAFGCWEEVPIDFATTKVLPGTWVFKVKRAPDGTFKKFKARYCIRGDLQEGEFETYAPVVQFSSVRLFLAWSLMLGWYTCSIDFSNAFIQAKLDEPTFIHLPRGFRNSGLKKTCLKLKKSLYGLAVAPRLWYKHLLNALEKKIRLKPSDHDPCLLMRKDLIVICYVDDLGIQAPNKQIVDDMIKELRRLGFDLTLEGSFSEYLGIQYTKLSETEMKMTQEGLIKKIMDATGMNDCNTNRTPTTKEALASDDEGQPMEDEWNYRSVVGMLLYLSTNTRPDISYAVSQVARFSHNPKKSHASAVKTIIRYLSGSIDQGVIYKRPENLCLDCYVDADFAGLYGRDPPESPTCVKSRTGYIISVGGCYLLCKSQLQTTIALSTSEAEYGALSQAMRAVIPIRETLLELIKAVDMVDAHGRRPFGDKNKLCSFPTVIHEDNSAALSLAVNQKVTSRTKHWCVKFHFFWSYVNNKDNNTSCVKVDTKEQRADYLTKGLTKDTFEHCRFLNQGW